MRILIAMLALLSLQAKGVQAPPAGRFHRCPPEGTGGDPILNRLRNRVTTPEAPTAVTVADITSFASPGILTGLERARWPASELAIAAAHEQAGGTLEGYLVAQRWNAREACNCDDPRWRSIVLRVGAMKTGAAREAVIAVVTPRWQEANPAWTEAAFRRLAAGDAHIRVTGWFFFADDKTPELFIAKTRPTLWEIHPVTRIEVESNGQWRELGEE